MLQLANDGAIAYTMLVELVATIPSALHRAMMAKDREAQV